MRETDKVIRLKSIMGGTRDTGSPEDLFLEAIAYMGTVESVGKVLSRAMTGERSPDDYDVETVADLIAYLSDRASELALEAWCDEARRREALTAEVEATATAPRAEMPQDGPKAAARVKPRTGPVPLGGVAGAMRRRAR